MKWLLPLLCLLPCRLPAQQLDSCGLNNSPTLNTQEAAYFNSRFQEVRGEFNFLNKRLIFITGESGSVLGSKRNYFDYVKKWQAEHGRSYIGGSNLIPFTEVQRLQSNGHDAIVTYWSKLLPSPNRVIRRVNRKVSKQKYPSPF
ncbi:hypothetical protein [Hymenobacter negativus]|uniref:DUF8192 domain-containing protein n=1 Tax=Hymenobacter negativus TaxID=2795026 RepID=A0ABS3QNX7_9BACT|nr:hypothetical protein [Hymenobacter negativus]MBO2012623.1 hypothetical protein [Hymenobacter negativus]